MRKVVNVQHEKGRAKNGAMRNSNIWKLLFISNFPSWTLIFIRKIKIAQQLIQDVLLIKESHNMTVKSASKKSK